MNKKKKITIQDIARELNTTISTVSRALRDHPRIGVETRERIKKYAFENDYQPDFRAASLRQGSARTIGVLVPRIDIHFFAKILTGIDEIASENNYNVLIIQSLDSLDKEINLVKSLVYGKVDGLIASISVETHNGEHFKSLTDKGVPLVLFDKVLEDSNVTKVIVDDYYGAFISVQHLINQGCKRIGHFAGPQHLNIYKDRLQGYLDALKDADLRIDENIIFYNMLAKERGYEVMGQLHKIQYPPDGIFSSSDFAVLGAIMRAKELGIRVPQDIAFTGFANEPLDEIFEPTISSIEQYPVKMGKEAARLLIQQMENERTAFSPQTITLKPSLVIRQSSLRNQ
jgi:LacI family transcriptional regulator